MLVGTYEKRSRQSTCPREMAGYWDPEYKKY
jgi:hypothetical protein